MGWEFDNSSYHHLAQHHGLSLHFSCPQTSSQNGKAERMIRRINDIVLALLSNASLPPVFWVEVLHAATYLHNILPTRILRFRSPASVLYLKHPTYDHLRVFGCLCYPNRSANRRHKLEPKSTRCVFLGYPANYRGYRCLDLATNKVILSRHVTFDEQVFSFSTTTVPSASSYSFLDPDQSSISPTLFDTFAYPTPTPPPQPPSPPISPSDHNITPTPPPSPLSPAHTPPSPPTPLPHPVPAHPMTTRAGSTNL